jgi:predicted transcriptional regulator
MSEEQNKAAFYQQHKDDPEVWGEPEENAPPTRRGGLSATITVRFSPEEASAIRELAQELHVPYSEIVRRAVRKFVHSRLAVGQEAQAESEDWHDYSFSTGGTRTGIPVLAGR